MANRVTRKRAREKTRAQALGDFGVIPGGILGIGCGLVALLLLIGLIFSCAGAIR